MSRDWKMSSANDETPEPEKPMLAPGCSRCAGHPWVEAPNGGVERCACARGRQLAAMDAQRKAEAQPV